MKTFSYLNRGTKIADEHYGVMFDDGVAVVWAICNQEKWNNIFILNHRGEKAVEAYYDIDSDNLVWNQTGFRQVKLFQLRRIKDVTGVSGEGVVAKGAQFPDGSAVVRWRALPASSTVIWGSVTEAMQVHGHDGNTVLEWLDES